MPYKFLSLPHRGLSEEIETNGFFDKTLEACTGCRDFILDLHKKNIEPEAMLDLFFKQYGNETLFSYQPKDAFFANARATIACTLREFASDPGAR